MIRMSMGGLVAVLGLLAPWVPAAAQVNLAAQAGNLHYTVTDLAPGDGIAPALNFTGTPLADMYGKVTAYGGVVAAQGYDTRLGQGPGAIVLDPWAGTHLGVGFLGTDLVAAASLTPIPGLITQDHEFAALQPWDFELAPHTQVTFSLDMAVDLTSPYGDDAEAQILFNATFNPANGGPVSLSDGLGGLIGAFRMHELVKSDTDARTGTIQWTNDSDAWVTGQLSYSVRLDSTIGSVSPIPEPSEWAMLLAGAGALCVRARRRGPLRAS